MNLSKSPLTLASTAMAGLALLSSPAEADLIIIPPENVTASSEIGGSFNRIDDFIVDGSGLTGGQHVAAVEPNMWLSTGNGFGGIDPDPFVIFDLGDFYTINSFHVWNYNEAPPLLVNRGVNEVSIEYGTTTDLGSTVPGITNFAQADGLITYAGENFSGFTPFNARYIKFNISSNHGDGSTFYGLSEVQFDGVLAPIPGPPTLIETNPADDASDVTISSNFVADFSKDIALTGSGTILLKNLSGGADLPITLPDDVTVSGRALTIDPASNLIAGDEYAVEISSDAIEDLDVPAAPYAGILATDDPNWSFRADGTAPSGSSMRPVADTTGVSTTSNLVLSFDEDVQVGAGSITIHLEDGTLVETIDATTLGAVLIDGPTVTIIRSLELASNTAYYVNIDPGTFEDLSGNSFAGITDTTTWAFRTLQSFILNLAADGQTFPAYFEEFDGKTWLLIGRGREGWEFDDDGQGAVNDVSQNVGTPSAFPPAAYSDAIVNDLLEQAGLTPGTLEVRLKRAATTNGTGYQDFRWRAFTGNGDAFTWNIEDSPYGVTLEIKDLAGLLGQQEGLTVVTDTSDNFEEGAGDDADRVFTWAWEGNNNLQGFAYGTQIVGVDTPSSYLWDLKNDGWAVPYTEVFIEYDAVAAQALRLVITSNGDTLDFQWNGLSKRQYDLVSSVDPAAEPDPSLWTLYNDGSATYENIRANSLSGVLRIGPTRLFALIEKEIPPLFSEDFEAGLGGFTVADHSAGGTGTDWEAGDPISGSAGAPNAGGFVDTGNGGSTNCVGTDLGDPGFHTADTDTCLRSPIIDLTGVAGATLSFAEALDIEGADTAVVNIIDDTDDNPATNIIAAAIYTVTDGDSSSVSWATVGPITIPGAALGQAVRIEWRFTGAGAPDTDYMGWYVDDVLVTESSP